MGMMKFSLAIALAVLLAVLSITTAAPSNLKDFETQYPAPWHLQMISNRDPKHYTYPYRFDDSAGSGVFVYVLDSGVNETHPQFSEGQVIQGTEIIPRGCEFAVRSKYHGTAVASMIAGRDVGVAKNATIVDVQVGAVMKECHDYDAMEQALLWTLLDIKRNRRENNSVVNISWTNDEGCGMMDFWINRLWNLGVPVVVAAGNHNKEAEKFCPANTNFAMTVASMDPFWSRSPFSNYGFAVDIFAPGGHVSLASTEPGREIGEFHGTSFAAPMVAGVIAYLIAKDGHDDPEGMFQTLRDLATNDVLGNTEGTPNLLLYNGIGFY